MHGQRIYQNEIGDYMKKEIRLLSLDCSTKCSGLAVWDNGEYKESHIIDMSNIKDVEERQKQMGLKLWRGLDYYSPSIVFIEDTYCHGNPETQKKLNRIQGVVFTWCILNNAEFHCIMPSAWRKYIPDFPNGKGIKRQEQKNFSITYVINNYGITPASDDQADAILIGEGALRMYKEKV